MRRMLYFIKRWQNEGTSRLRSFKSNMGGLARPSSRQWLYRVFLVFLSKFILDSSFPRRDVAVQCEHAAINKLSRAGKVGGSGPRRDRGIGRKKDHWL